MSTILDINAEARDLCDADSTSLPDATLLRRVNKAYEDVVGLILNCDGRWQFDDSNFTTFPIGTTTLVASQQDYTFDVSHLRLLRVSVKNANGDYVQISPIDFDDIVGDPSEFYNTAGMPTCYDVQGSSILLYPAPATGSVTTSEGLKVFFQRTADVFTAAQVTAGTKVPGFASPFHMLLAYKAALPYCMKFKPERVQGIQTEIANMVKGLETFYSKRQKDERFILKMKPPPNFV